VQQRSAAGSRDDGRCPTRCVISREALRVNRIYSRRTEPLRRIKVSVNRAIVWSTCWSVARRTFLSTDSRHSTHARSTSTCDRKSLY